MRRFIALLGLPLLLMAAGCASGGDDTADGSASPDHLDEAFHQRAAEVAGNWRPGPTWTDGYVPLQGPTVLVGDPDFTPDTEAAFRAGWFRAQVALPGARPADGVVRFPDGRLTVPLVSAEEAYRQLDQGDPPPCAGRPKEPATPPPAGPSDGPDAATGDAASFACIPLTVTRVELGAATVRTSRGEAQVPAWLFTVEEIAAPVARLAVATEAVAEPPQPTGPKSPAPEELVGAQDLVSVDGATLTYHLGVGSCDTGITPLVREQDGTVVVGGSVVRSTGVCDEMLNLEPVTVTLDAPLAARPVLDVVTGAPLRFTGR
ncbi:hypothetical protein GA0070616_3676 [Micromonospora nigra]|uniref:META domain-containing protein n=1 Tax=Micromonospora nigra TaxID=145857 RepID=A0A1C6SFT9_9ACTN|nr:hypothetical protein [Micromonospora nigra]SCL28350.1 hypothetical protein GA0070616_3676 [Micromonospora nigra]